MPAFQALIPDNEEENYSNDDASCTTTSSKRHQTNDGQFNILTDVGKSSKDHYSSLQMHINIMLSCHKTLYKSPLFYNKTLPDSFDDITYDLVSNHHFVSVVLHYFGCTAKTYGKVNNPLMSYKSADTYYSSFKTYFCRNKFNTDAMPIPFEDRFWSVYRKRLTRWKEAQSIEKGLGVELVKPKETASEDDIWTIFVMCTWSNMVSGFMFACLLNVLIQIGGCISKACTMLKTEMQAKVSSSSIVMYVC